MSPTKVILIKSPEYETERFREVCELLTDFNGALAFVPDYYEFDRKMFYFLRYELYPVHGFQYPSEDVALPFDQWRTYPLSWHELFTLCNFYREQNQVEEKAIVVLLTKRKNGLNWFSAHDRLRNIFVHTAEWENYTPVNPRYPIAYQVVENVMQILMNLHIDGIQTPYFHDSPIGCMNDFCLNKSQVIIKLQTANICPTCLKRMHQEKISAQILEQVKSLFAGIRQQFVFLSDVPTALSPIHVDADGRIMLSDYGIELTLPPQHKTLYLFLLSRPGGVRVNQLVEHKEEFLGMYKRLKPKAERRAIEKVVKNLVHPFGVEFNVVRSHINKRIAGLLTDSLAAPYQISGRKNSTYYIRHPDVTIEFAY